MPYKSPNTSENIAWYRLTTDQLYSDQFFQFVQDHLQEDPALLLLKQHGIDGVDLKEAVQQIAARQKAAGKLPEWVADPRVLFPASLSLEQSSSELTAKFKAKRISGATLIDLTGGLGVDTFYMGQRFEKVVYLERQEALAKIAAHNFSILNQSKAQYHVLAADSISYLKESGDTYDWLYVDPARRGANDSKLYKLSDCEPDILRNWELLTARADHIMVKASPMLDIKAALQEIPEIKEVTVVAVKNEVKEVLLVWHKGELAETGITTVNLKEGGEERFVFTFTQEKYAEADYSLPQQYLIEPNAALLKAGGFKSFASAYGLAKIHPNTHLYTASDLPAKIPARVFEIVKEVKLDKKELKRMFPSGKVNVLVRNHPLKPDVLKKKYGLKDGGSDFLLAATTMDGKARAYWCRRVLDVKGGEMEG
jgi:16S rRNA G966 N2-methylase RsmD